jgi:hypothetical protein
MGTDPGGNNEEQAKRLVFKAPLPPSGVDSKFLKVEKNHIVFHADCSRFGRPLVETTSVLDDE